MTNDAGVIGAIRLALEGAANDATALAVIAKLCEYAPATDPTETYPTSLFVRAIQAVNGTFIVGVSPERKETRDA